MRLMMIFFPVIGMLGGCIDPLPLKIEGDEPALVVDGMITDQRGPYMVELSMSQSPNEAGNSPQMVTGASVLVESDKEQVFEFTETSPGVYDSDPEFQAEVGTSYFLKIVLKDGTEYRSTPETLQPAGILDSLYYVYDDYSINKNDLSLPQDAITFYVDGASDPWNPDGLLRWRSRSIFEILTFPERRTKAQGDRRVPDPLPCSGYINSNDELKSVDTCSCCNCWVYDYSRTAVVSPTRFAKNNHYRVVPVARVPVDSWRFFRKFYFEVEQLSVSEKVFEFWKRTSAQQQGTGSLFQPNAIRIQGNMRCITDAGRPVFGIFAAAGISKKSVFVTRADLPKILAEPPEVLFDCRYWMENSDNIKPPFW